MFLKKYEILKITTQRIFSWDDFPQKLKGKFFYKQYIYKCCKKQLGLINIWVVGRPKVKYEEIQENQQLQSVGENGDMGNLCPPEIYMKSLRNAHIRKTSSETNDSCLKQSGNWSL